jgi:two-component system OmpR family sensor kinase
MSIRLRLTLLYSAILALTLVFFSATLYVIQSQYTLSVLRRDLAANAQQIAVRVALLHRRQDRSRPGPEIPHPDPGPVVLGQQALQDMRVRDIVCILDVSGALVESPGGQDDVVLPLSEQGLRAAQDGEAWTEVASVEGERTLIYVTPVITEGQVTGIVQVGRSLVDRDRSLSALGATLIAGTIVTTLVAFGIGWALSGITLRPIHRITQTAQAIGTERDFGRRVAYTGPSDEVGQLAATFNAMLTQLQAAYWQIARALQMQREFLADVSHELRTPLTTVRGNLALLGRRPPIKEEEREDVLADMVDESERLIRLVNDLLTLARAEAGRKVETERVALKSLVEDVCRQARLLEPDRTIECQPTDDLSAQANRDALKQVLLILLDNALKHTPGPVRVTLGRRGDRVAIVVHDTGAGMSPEQCEHIFDRFYRGDESRTTPGFGLGLSIAKALVEAQQGTITVESEEGKGSTFAVILYPALSG